jgi:hypothetical protein
MVIEGHGQAQHVFPGPLSEDLSMGFGGMRWTGDASSLRQDTQSLLELYLVSELDPVEDVAAAVASVAPPAIGLGVDVEAGHGVVVKGAADLVALGTSLWRQRHGLGNHIFNEIGLPHLLLEVIVSHLAVAPVIGTTWVVSTY